MKNLGIFTLVFFLFSCENTTLNADKKEEIAIEENNLSTEKSFIKNVSVDEFKKLIENGSGIILDVRTPEETSQGHIENASIINFYDEDFERKINLMQKDKEIYVYCKSGGRSAQAAEILSQNGFTQIYNLQGGIMAWENKNYPLTEPTENLDNNINTVSIEEFEQLIHSDLPVLVDFHTLWCAPCKKMAPIIDELEEKYKGKAIVKRIDAEASKELAKEYQIQGVPEFFLFVNGEKVWQHNGLIEKSILIDKIEEVLN